LVYASDTDDIGQCWCGDCREWIPADKWNQPCLSKRERRKKNRRVSAGTEGPGLREALDLLRRVCEWHAQETIYPTPECIGEARRFVRRTNLALARVEGEKK
jgi:hypothetical protein